MKSYQEFFAELKRRHVFKVAGVYGIVAFGVLQAADLALPRLGMPDWTVTFMLALVLLAFPVVLIIAWAFEVTPDGVKKTDAAAPGEIEAIVSAPMSQRWPSGLLALVGGAALIAGGWWVGQRTGGDSGTVSDAGPAGGARLAYVDLSDDPRPSIAVLPFADMSPDGDQEYFSDGMTEEILNVLAKIRELRVAARTSTFALKDQDLTAAQWGDTLHVAYFVEGSVRKAGDQLRITAQLIDTSDGSHLWSENYDRSLDNVFQIQSEIAEAIADALTVPLGLTEGSDLVSPTADIEAYDLYLTGRARLRERGAGVFEAVDLFKAAVARDSMWAPAWAGLADATSLQVWYDFPQFHDRELPFDETLAEAEQAARRALNLNPRNPTALIALGNIQRDRYRWAEAEELYLQALDLDPDNAEAHQQYAEFLHKRGRVAEAVRSIDRAAALDPAPVRIYQFVKILRKDDRWDDVEEVLAWAVARGLDERFSPLAVWARQAPMARARSEGRYEDAVDSAPESPADTAGFGERQRALSAGRFDMLPDSMRDLERLGPEDLVRLDEPDLAVEQVVRRLTEIEATVLTRLTVEFVWDVALDDIRDDRRVQAALESIGLGGLTVQRTPVGERVRPAILRQADADAGAEGTPR